MEWDPKKISYDLGINFLAGIALLLALWLSRGHAGMTLLAAALLTLSAALFLVSRRPRRRYARIDVATLSRHILPIANSAHKAPWLTESGFRESLEDAMIVSAILLDQEQLSTGLWGRTILRYGDLHFRLAHSDRDTYAAVGSISHSAHALRGFAAVSAIPLRLHTTVDQLNDCIQKDGHIYPLDRSGRPTITNLSEAKHVLTAGRHTSTGAVAYALCRAMAGTADQEGLAPVIRAISVLHRHVDDLKAHPAGYSHAYVLEATAYAASAFGRSHDVVDLGRQMADHLLSVEARRNGFWNGGGSATRSLSFFGSIIGERLFWACDSNILDNPRKKDAVEAVSVFVTRVLQELTDPTTGGVRLDFDRDQTDYGTTARCVRLALRVASPATVKPWLLFLKQNTPSGVTDDYAYTHTWEATLLLGSATLGKASLQRVRRQIEEFQIDRGQTLDNRIASALSQLKQSTAAELRRALISLSDNRELS